MSMLPAPFVRWPVALALAVWAYGSTHASPQLPPTFHGKAELFTIHVQVVAARGGIMPPLSIEQFEVSMGGRPRVVRFAELVRLDDGRAEGAAPRPAPKSKLIAEDGFFQPFPNRPSAQYLLGIEVPQPHRDLAVSVKVQRRFLQVRRWMWRTTPPSLTASLSSAP